MKKQLTLDISLMSKSPKGTELRCLLNKWAANNIIRGFQNSKNQTITVWPNAGFEGYFQVLGTLLIQYSI